MDMDREWRDVVGYNGNYRVSSDGVIVNCKREKIVRSFISRLGYVKLNLYLDNHRTTHLVHRLVAKAFISNPNNFPDVNHINGIKSDNRVENLEWCTKSHNGKHAFKNGLSKSTPGESSCNAKLTNDDVLSIRKLGASRKGYKAIADKYGVTISTISIIVRRVTWKHI